ncbi:hypothetical protein ASF13_03425 [Erwinia sp. Leaf53]|nr:hypothetical protein ASF13_03425 [Erwinia sp. Leaf53]
MTGQEGGHTGIDHAELIRCNKRKGSWKFWLSRERDVARIAEPGRGDKGGEEAGSHLPGGEAGVRQKKSVAGMYHGFSFPGDSEAGELNRRNYSAGPAD